MNKKEAGKFSSAKETQVKVSGRDRTPWLRIFRGSHHRCVLQIGDCYADTVAKAKEHCGEGLKALLKCLSARDPPVLKCEALRGQFEQCYESKALAPLSKR